MKPYPLSSEAPFPSHPNENMGFRHAGALDAVIDRRSFMSMIGSTGIFVTFGEHTKHTISSQDPQRVSILLFHSEADRPNHLVRDLLDSMDTLRKTSSETPIQRTMIHVQTMPFGIQTTPSEILNRLDERKEEMLAVLGFGFGGTLALWTALQHDCADAPRPSVAISVNGLLDLKWAIDQGHLVDGHKLEKFAWLQEQEIVNPSDDPFDFKNRSPIDMLPPASKSLRQKAVNTDVLVPPDSPLGLFHEDCQKHGMPPIEHSTRFTVAACVGGVEVDFHRIRSHGDSDVWKDPQSSEIWKAVKSTLWQALKESTESSSVVPDRMTFEEQRKLLVEPPLMKPTVRIETETEVLIQTRRALS